MKNKKIILATHNEGKQKEFAKLLSPLGVELVRLMDFSGESPEETGQTFLENALIKARAASQLSGLPAIADDSGLCVEALGGAPGVYSSRFAGCDASDQANCDALLEKMKAIGLEKRRAKFVTVLVYLKSPDDPLPCVVQGDWHGSIALSPSGETGFGYDPIFYLPDLGCTAASLAPEQKNHLSHRGKAARMLVEHLRTET